MIDIVVADEQSANVVWLDESEHVAEVFVAVLGQAGDDDDGPTFNRYVSPWLTLVDDRRYRKTVDRVEALRPSVIAACHTPAIHGGHVAHAIEVTRRTPSMSVAAQPDQSVLDQIQRTLAGDVAA